MPCQLPPAIDTQALAAVPRHAPGVRLAPDRRGRPYLDRSPPPGGRGERWAARLFGWRRRTRFQLDQVAARFWELIDGQRDLAAIAAVLCGEYGWEEEAGREAVAQFVCTLMERHLILLDLSYRAEQT